VRPDSEETPDYRKLTGFGIFWIELSCTGVDGLIGWRMAL
jgi:hypothetical protein